MRRIISKEEIAKKRRRNQFIVGGILIFVMFGSVFGIIVNSFGNQGNTNNLKYNGFEFTKYNGFWVTKINNKEFIFRYHPDKTIKINNTLRDLKQYFGAPLYISSDSNEAMFELYRNLGDIAQRIQPACLDNCSKNIPKKTCDNNFIIIKNSNQSLIKQNKNCVFIEGDQKDLTQLTDTFLFKLLKISN